MSEQDTTRMSRSLGLSPEERLARIESDIAEVNEKLSKVLDTLGAGNTRFTTIEITISSLTERIKKLEDGRDMVIKIVMGAVALGLLGLLGLKAVG